MYYRLMSSAQRIKGHNFERQVVNLFKPFFPECMRQLEYQEGLGVDLKNTGDFHIQCKVGKSFNIEKALKEATTSKDKIPLAITKKDRSDILVTMYFEDFQTLLFHYLKSQK